MKVKLVATAGALALVAALAAGSQAATASKSATLVIRHQTRGCHTWSFNHNAYKAAEVARLARGTTLTVINNDVMPQKLVQKSGPAVRYAGSPAMNRVGASVKITFAKAGVYSFLSRAGEDYSWAKNAKTIGEDNVLTLKVIVS
jgi:plastocyanin